MSVTTSLKPMSEISMLTIAIRAAATVRNKNGDSSIQGYVEMQDSGISQEMPEQVDLAKETDFALLECVSDILVQGTQVLAASYNDATSYTLVVPSSDNESHWNSESHPEAFDMDFPPHESVGSATILKSINAAIIPNPDRKRKCLSSPLEEIQEVESGGSLWNSHSKDPLGDDVLLTDPSTPEGLAKHAESVSCYLYEYGRAGDKASGVRSQYSKSFFLYLLATSWIKMHTRFCSWQSLGFIQALENSIGNDIASKVEEFCDHIGLPQELGPGDRTLADFFSQNENFLCKILTINVKKLPSSIRSKLSKQANPSPSGFEDAIPDENLTFHAFGEAVKLSLKDRDKSTAFYTKESAVVFHCLLFLSFLTVGNALRTIKDYHRVLNKSISKLKPEDIGSYKRAVMAAELPVRFLICMLSSRAYKLHMRVWTHEGSSINHLLPSFKQKREYIIFGKERSILASSKLGPGPISELEDFELEDDMTEFPECSYSLSRFNRWVSIFVAHFLAKRTLEYQSAQIFKASPDLFKKPEIKILAVMSEDYSVPSWDQFKQVIGDAFTIKDDKATVDRIITTLEDRVKHGYGLARDAQRSLNDFRRIITGDLEIYNIRMHCEAVLAAILDAQRTRVSQSSDSDTMTKLGIMGEISKTLGRDMISVSKLCCPVCWELFKVLDLNIKIRGCHPTVSPLALPDTFSPEILEEMVKSLRTQLASQLRYLVNEPPRTIHHFRNESETGHSATSSNEGSSRFTDAYKNFMLVDQEVTRTQAKATSARATGM